MNCHTSTVSGELEILRISHEVEREQRAALADRRANRDQAAVDAALDRLLAATRAPERSGNLIPVILDAARADATLGEICRTMGEEFGGYVEAPRF